MPRRWMDRRQSLTKSSGLASSFPCHLRERLGGEKKVWEATAGLLPNMPRCRCPKVTIQQIQPWARSNQPERGLERILESFPVGQPTNHVLQLFPCAVAQASCVLFNWGGEKFFLCYSIFIFIWQLLSNYRLTKLKRFVSKITGKLHNWLFLSIFNVPYMCHTIRYDEKSWKVFKFWVELNKTLDTCIFEAYLCFCSPFYIKKEHTVQILLEIEFYTIAKMYYPNSYEHVP